MNIDSREGFSGEEFEAYMYNLETRAESWGDAEYEAWLDATDGFDAWRDDVDADADTLASAGWGTDEDYNYDGECYDWE